MKFFISLLIISLYAVSIYTSAQAQDEDLREPREHFQSVFVPFVLAGKTFPAKADNTASGLAFSTGAIFGFRSPALLFRQLGMFVAGAYESDHFSISQPISSITFTNNFSVEYFTLTPGVSYRGILNLGVAFGIPLSSSLTVYSSSRVGSDVSVSRENLNLVIEPRVFLGYPLSVNRTSRTALILLAQAGYSLTNVFKNSDLQYEQLNTGDVRLPNVKIGLAYVIGLNEHSAY